LPGESCSVIPTIRTLGKSYPIQPSCFLLFAITTEFPLVFHVAIVELVTADNSSHAYLSLNNPRR
jgi:hypothetical protein